MPLDHFDIGDQIAFTYLPKDAAGAPVSPDSATLTINFIGENGPEAIDPPITMTPPGVLGAPWTATWNTKDIGAKPGQVDWCITASVPDDVVQKSFFLDANRANTN